MNAREEMYAVVRQRLDGIWDSGADAIALMATVACELHAAFGRFSWTGFYRVIAPELLAVGPYQGGHGCLLIPFARGVCGRCARSGRTQVVGDVLADPEHIACSAATRAEIVVPVMVPGAGLRAVLDIDAEQPDAFDATDCRELEAICARLGQALGEHAG
ncbi:MAG: GAF domain-containing protein [Planctomycetota bacterium]